MILTSFSWFNDFVNLTSKFYIRVRFSASVSKIYTRYIWSTEVEGTSKLNTSLYSVPKTNVPKFKKNKSYCAKTLVVADINDAAVEKSFFLVNTCHLTFFIFVYEQI